jgi:hypothetical protein
MTVFQPASDVIVSIAGLVVSGGLGVAPLVAMSWVADRRRAGLADSFAALHIRAALAWRRAQARRRRAALPRTLGSSASKKTRKAPRLRASKS